MSQSDKAALFRALKDAGVQFEKHYREYKTEDLQTAYDAMVTAGQIVPEPAAPELPPEPEQPLPEAGTLLQDEELDAAAESFFGLHRPEPVRSNTPSPDEMPGMRINTHQGDDVIRIDEMGRRWHQEQILKPAYPKPRARRVLKYLDTGVTTQTVKGKDGFVESFEIAGTGAPRTAEVKITLPSYQVGIYSDPRFPFKVHVYNGVEGFDLFDVRDYYGGAELVPPVIKRVYVENDLCYDIRTTVQAINDEYRQLQLTGKIKETDA